MQINTITLEAKRQEYLAAAEQHRALMNANAGAAQALEEIQAVMNAPEPENTEKEN